MDGWLNKRVKYGMLRHLWSCVWSLLAGAGTWQLRPRSEDRWGWGRRAAAGGTTRRCWWGLVGEKERDQSGRDKWEDWVNRQDWNRVAAGTTRDLYCYKMLTSQFCCVFVLWMRNQTTISCFFGLFYSCFTSELLYHGVFTLVETEKVPATHAPKSQLLTRFKRGDRLFSSAYLWVILAKDSHLCYLLASLVSSGPRSTHKPDTCPETNKSCGSTQDRGRSERSFLSRV